MTELASALVEGQLLEGFWIAGIKACPASDSLLAPFFGRNYSLYKDALSQFMSSLITTLEQAFGMLLAPLGYHVENHQHEIACAEDHHCVHEVTQCVYRHEQVIAAEDVPYGVQVEDISIGKMIVMWKTEFTNLESSDTRQRLTKQLADA
jgi:hypothetical protein